MKTIVVLAIVLSSCSKTTIYRYNICDFYKENITDSSDYGGSIKLLNAKFNNINKRIDSTFYGVFRAEYKGCLYNVLVLNTSFDRSTLGYLNDSKTLDFTPDLSPTCTSFISTINIEEYNKNEEDYPVIIGRFRRVVMCGNRD